MSKIKHLFTTLQTKASALTLTTPGAIILGSIIIALAIVTYGFIIANGTGKSTTSISNPLPALLKSVSVKEKAFNACLQSGTMTQFVNDSITDGSLAGVNGTPNTFIIRVENAIPYVVANISGAVSYDVFKEAVEQALSSTAATTLPVFKGKMVQEEETERGTISGQVYVIEYSDSECPFCIRAHSTMKQLRSEYGARINFVYRHFPLTSIHPHAQKEAEMIACVQSLGGAKAMYPFIDGLFSFKIKNNIGYIPTEQ